MLPTFHTSPEGIDNLKFRGNKTFCLIIILYCLGMPVFVNHRVVIAETFAEKHFC